MVDTELRCQCGCGGLIPPISRVRHFTPRFIKGHHLNSGGRAVCPPVKYLPTPDEIPSGICECGCGSPTPIAKGTSRVRRYFKGHPMPYARGHWKQPAGSLNHNWRGGRTRTAAGYICINVPDHPFADANGNVKEHRLVMEQKLGRLLTPAEHVHHLNEIKDDNRPENLAIMSRAEHAAAHGLSTEARAMRSAAGKKGAEARWGKKP